MSEHVEIPDIRSLNVGDRFVIKDGPLFRTMRVTAKTDSGVEAVWDPDSQERTDWNAFGWDCAKSLGWI